MNYYKIINYHLIADIALGDLNFQKSILLQYEKDSEKILNRGSQLVMGNSCTALHLELKEYRNKIAPLLNRPSINRVNAVLELLISSMNPSVKLQAYKELSQKIKREIGFLSIVA